MEARIKSILENNNINMNLFTDFVGSVILSERLNGTNNMEVDIDRFASQFPNFGIKLNTNRDIKPLPKVQVMRIFIDSIILCLNKMGVPPKNVHFTMPSSKYVGVGRIVHTEEGYSDEAECERLLKILEKSSDDNYSDCKEFFEYVSSKLEFLKSLRISEILFESADFSKIFLPEPYNCYGYNVSRTIPDNLKSFSKVERVSMFENNFAVHFCSNFIRITYSATGDSTDVSDDDMLAALMVLNNVHRLIRSDLPIGIDTASSKLHTAWIPKHKNKSSFQIFSGVFSIDTKATLQDVEILCKLLKILEEVHQ